LWAPRPADPVGLVTERTRQALWWLRHAARGTSRPSAPRSSFVSTPYIGHLKGVGKVWQITACDAASSYGIARILPALSALAVAHFLRASSPGRRVLTGGGGEFKAEFDLACAALGVRHTRISPRHAWANGFVERLQQTILTEHWRVVFRRYYFTRRASLDRSLLGFR